MVRIVLIILLLCSLGAMYYIMNNTIYNLKSNILNKEHQYQSLRKKYNFVIRSQSEKISNIYISSVTVCANRGIINDNTLIRLAPLDDSILINQIKEKTEVKIIDEIECGSNTWFYISIPDIGKINSKGWIKKSDFSLIESNNKNIIIND